MSGPTDRILSYIKTIFFLPFTLQTAQGSAEAGGDRSVDGQD